MTCSCPTCGQTLPIATVQLEAEAGLVIAAGRFAQLTRHEVALFEKLWASGARVVSKEQLMTAIYSLNVEEEPEIKIIDVYVCKLRRKLKDMGFKIQTVWGSGYRMTWETGNE